MHFYFSKTFFLFFFYYYLVRQHNTPKLIFFSLLFQVYWLGPMCGGVAAALIYDFLLCPRSHSLNSRWQVLANGPESENYAAVSTREGNVSPGPSQWPKWVSCSDTRLLFVTKGINVILNKHVNLFWGFFLYSQYRWISFLLYVSISFIVV